MTSKELSAEAIAWLVSGEHGISSEALFNRTLLDQVNTQWLTNYPHDPDDFRRCQLLVRAVPEVRERLSLMGDQGPEWARLVEHWDEITTSLESEVPGVFGSRIGGNAPRTYKLMRSFIEGK